MAKKYLIDEHTLRGLLISAHQLDILERNGVDVEDYASDECHTYLAECAAELPQYKDYDWEDLKPLIASENYDIQDLVDDQIEAFWKEDVQTQELQK